METGREMRTDATDCVVPPILYEVIATDNLTESQQGGLSYWNEIVRWGQIGHGTFGRVFAAGTYHYDPDCKELTKVAVKEMLRRPFDRILSEVEILKRCNHRMIVELYEVIDDPRRDKVCLVTEELVGGEVVFCSGLNTPSLATGETKYAIRGAALGLAYLHQLGIIHRDIKPANLVWVTNEKYRVKIVDFGSAYAPWLQRLGLGGSEALLQGTPGFCSPELVKKWNEPPDSNADHVASYVQLFTPAVDLWALGVTLYCCIFGRYPFGDGADNEDDMHRSVLTDQLDLHGNMGTDMLDSRWGKGLAIKKLLNDMLEKDIDNRITEIGQLKRNRWLFPLNPPGTSPRAHEAQADDSTQKAKVKVRQRLVVT